VNYGSVPVPIDVFDGEGADFTFSRVTVGIYKLGDGERGFQPARAEKEKLLYQPENKAGERLSDHVNLQGYENARPSPTDVG
jgi:hypothetical protein